MQSREAGRRRAADGREVGPSRTTGTENDGSSGGRDVTNKPLQVPIHRREDREIRSPLQLSAPSTPESHIPEPSRRQRAGDGHRTEKAPGTISTSRKRPSSGSAVWRGTTAPRDSRRPDPSSRVTAGGNAQSGVASLALGFTEVIRPGTPVVHRSDRPDDCDFDALAFPDATAPVTCDSTGPVPEPVWLHEAWMAVSSKWRTSCR
jgi:hypothetical protein